MTFSWCFQRSRSKLKDVRVCPPPYTAKLAAVIRVLLQINISLALLAQTTKPIVAYEVESSAGLPGGDHKASKKTGSDAHQGIYNVSEFGAQCDGVTDDAAAFNKVFDAIRKNNLLAPGSWSLGRSGRVTAPAGKCLIRSTLNMTELYGSGFVIDFWGTQILCKTSGRPCVDLSGTGQQSILGLNIFGSESESPNIGLLLSRSTPALTTAADHGYLEHPTIQGNFTLAAAYLRSTETTLLNHGEFINYQDNGYGMIFDGSNAFRIQSAFTKKDYANGYSSFNEPTCIVCIVEAGGANATPIWIGGVSRLKFIGSYLAKTGSGSGPGIIINFSDNIPNSMLDLDIHSENASLGSVVRFDGARNVRIAGFRLNEPQAFQTGPIFLRGEGVDSVTIENADITIGSNAAVGSSWWDMPAAYTVSGKIFSGDTSYTAPGVFTGMYCIASACNTTYTMQPELNVNSLINVGGLGRIVLTSPGGYLAGSVLPSCRVGPPSSGGQQATCAVNYLRILGSGSIGDYRDASGSLGSGYKVNDVVSFAGGSCKIQPQMKISSVGNVNGVAGVVTGFLFQHGGQCSVAPPVDAYGETATRGGHGSGLTFKNPSYRVDQILVTNNGSNYAAPPAIEISSKDGSTAAVAVALLTSSMTLRAGSGHLVLDETGTRAGIAGSSGYPFLSAGALIDGSGVRHALTGAPYIVPRNTSLVRFIQTVGVHSQIVQLPVALADGHSIQFVNYAGRIDKLTFSPAVNGWAADSALASNRGLRVRWDATLGGWFREQ